MIEQITAEWLEENGACWKARKAFTKETDHGTFATLERLISRGQLDWANWLVVRLMKTKQQGWYAVFAAERARKYFEIEYPDDDTVKNAIEAAKACLESPTEKNRSAAHAAAYAARAAAYAAHSAAYSAFYAAARAANAAYAARAATASYAAARAVYYAADAAARAAVDAARAAANAAATFDQGAWDNEMEKIIRHGISILKGTDHQKEE